MTSTMVHKTIKILHHIFTSYGLPEQLVSDNGPQFVANEFEELMLKNGINTSEAPPITWKQMDYSRMFRAIIQKSDESWEE